MLILFLFLLFWWLVVQFSRLDGWVAEWQITNEQCRVLYETLHRITLQQNLTKESAAFLTKLLEYYSGDAESLKASKAFAKKLIGLVSQRACQGAAFPSLVLF